MGVKPNRWRAVKKPEPPIAKEKSPPQEKIAETTPAKTALLPPKASTPPVEKKVVKKEDKKPSEPATKVALAPIPKETIPPSEKKAEPSINGNGKKKSGIRKPFELTEITIEENKDQSVLSFHIPNIDKSISYKVSTEVFNGKTWIILRTKPLLNKLDQPFTTDSPVVGQVLINQDQDDKLMQLLIIIQVKPTRFYVTREKDVLKVTMRRSA